MGRGVRLIFDRTATAPVARVGLPSSSLRSHLGALALLGLLATVMTWPLAAHFATHVPGDPADPGDYWAYYWDLWWVKTAIFDEGRSPLYTSLLYRPDGTSLYFHSLLLAPSVIMSPITATLGPTFSYNLLVWLSFAGSAWGTYALLLTLCGRNSSRPAAFAAAVVYAFSAYRFSRMMGHLDLLSTEWLPLALLFLVRLWRAGGRLNGLGVLIFTALTALTNWYLGASLALFMVVALFQLWFTAGWRAAALALRRVALPVLAAALVASPAWIGLLHHGGAGGRLTDPLGDCIANSADVLGFVLPSSAHPIWGHAVAATRHDLFGPRDNVVENTVFLGFVPLALALLGWRQAASWENRIFRSAFVTFTVLSLGPHLLIAGRTLRIAGHAVPMPYQLLMQLPYGSLAHAPARFVLTAGLALAILAGLGAHRLMRDRSARAARAYAAVIATLALFETAAVPYPLARVHVPAAYDHLPHGGSTSGVLLEVPIPDWPAQLPQRMLYQTHHRHPVFGGYLSRSLPPHPFHAIPGFRDLKRLAIRPDIDKIDEADLPAVARVALRAYGTSHVMLLKDDFRYLPGLESKATAARETLVALLGPPTYEDAEAALFVVREATTAPFVSPERGFSPLEGTTAAPGRAVTCPARIGLWATDGGTFRVALSGYALEQAQHVQLECGRMSKTASDFSTTSPTSAEVVCRTRRGWQLIELSCAPHALMPDVASAKEGPSLVLTSLNVEHQKE
jgi:hypothetical protein